MGGQFIYGRIDDYRWQRHTVQTLARIFHRQAKVCELIDKDTNWWNIPLKEEVFNAEEATLIYSMPICQRTQSDRRVWGGNKTSDYTVCSACH